jgi:hypothetical protein
MKHVDVFSIILRINGIEGSISNPNLCSSCKETIQELEVTIQKSLDEQISKVFSRKWLGSIKKENSLLCTT